MNGIENDDPNRSSNNIDGLQSNLNDDEDDEVKMRMLIILNT